MKKIVPSTWDFGQARTTVIGEPGAICQDGICKLVKSASYIFNDVLKGWKPEPGELPVHVVIVGSTEYYGPNRNGDGFREETCRKYHNTFVKHARFYRNHVHNDPARSYGLVKFSSYNERMHRIELIGVLNATEEAARRNGGLVADREIELIKSGSDLPVSMSCIVEPHVPVLTDRGYVPISMVEPGMLVLTHLGRWRKVKEVKQRKYKGLLCELKVTSGFPIKITYTEDHPLLAAEEPATFSDFDWYEVKHLNPSFIIAPPATRPMNVYRAYEDDPNYWDLVVAIQEFCVNKKSWYKQGYFELLINDAAIASEIINSAYKSFGFMVSTRNDGHRYSLIIDEPELITMVGNSLAYDLDSFPHHIYSYREEVRRRLAMSYLKYFKRYRIPEETLEATGIEIQSLDIACGLRDLMASFGIPVMVSQGVQVPRSASNRNYFFRFRAGHVSTILGYVPTVPFEPDLDLYRPQLLEDGTPAVFRVKVARKRDVEEEVTVYNLEVEEDESYVIGYVSHNCTVSHDICSGCGNKARSRSEYCGPDKCPRGGLKRNMGKLFKDGHVLHADNPDPKFFDVSYVHRPADRAAYVLGPVDEKYLEKVAAETRELLPFDIFRPEVLRSEAVRYSDILRKVADTGWSFERVGIENELLPDSIVNRYNPAELIALSRDKSILLPPLAFAGAMAGNDVVRIMPALEKEASYVYERFPQLCGLAINDGLPPLSNFVKSASWRSIAPDDVLFLEKQFGLSPLDAVKRISSSSKNLIKVSQYYLSDGLTDFARKYISYAASVLEAAEKLKGINLQWV